MKKGIIIGLIAFLILAVYFSNFFIEKKRDFDENSILKKENQDLRAQLQRNNIFNLTTENNNYLTVKVFSKYPFNVKNQITVNVGSNHGVKNGATVTFGENILVGKVVNVYDNYSVIKTIFDADWKLPVRIGEREIDGLCEGGVETKISLIEKSSEIKVGDFVYSASSEFPYGLKIGEIIKIKENASSAFKEAIIKTPFNLSELREVNIIK